MPVRIVTDSSADLPPRLAESSGITVVPLTVNFGDERRRDGVDLDAETFYRRLATGAVHPSTSQITAAEFAAVYAGLAGPDDVVSIHAAAELSGTVNSARQAARGASPGRRIEVVDGRSTSMAIGLVVLEAARLAREGATIETVLDATRRHIARAGVWFTLETLEYLARGGRIGRAKHLIGALLRIKPLLTIADGIVEPVAQLRTRAQAVQALARAAIDRRPLARLSVGYSTDSEAAVRLADRLAADELMPREAILLTRLGPAIGTHVGPGCLSVALLRASGGGS